MAKQPIPKKEIKVGDKLASLKAFKEKNGLGKVVEKEPSWIILPEAFQKVTKIPGIPCGYVSRVRGKSNTGKSTMKLEVMKAALAQGILPVVFELENNFAWKHAKSIGVSITEEVDPDTGELVYGPGEDWLYYDTAKLYELYGKFDHEHGKWLSKPNRETYVIEDVALCIRDLIRSQKNGEIPFDMVFIIDSIGVGDCYRAAVNNSSNNMWYAGAVSVAFNTIVNDLIPSSRNVSSEYTNTMFFVQKTWTKTTATGLPSAVSKGGESMDWAVRISIYLGGIESASVRALTATSGGKDYKYGTKTKITIEKNHVEDITYSGEICCTHHGFWDPDKLDEYKKTYADEIKAKLASTNKVPASEIGEIEYTETEIQDEQ
jgi:hypothetical protein